MSGYGTYDWQSAEEQRRREIALLRGELAALRHRERTVSKLAAQARNAGLAVAEPCTVRTPAKEIADLTEAISRLRDSLQETERHLSVAWQSRYDTIARSGKGKTATRVSPSAVSELRTPEPPSEPDDTARLQATAQALVDEVAVRCEEADLNSLQRRLGTIMSATEDAGRVHALVLDLRGRAQDAIERATVTRRREETRARLLTLVEEIAGTERESLRRWVSTVPDPGVPEVEQTVLVALERDNHERARREVAATVAAALGEMGYDVGDEFTTTLADAPPPGTDADAAAIVPLPEFPGHGLRMTFDSADRLFTTVVRGRDADATRDTPAQDAVCRQLDELARRASADGVELRMVRRVAPGERPAPVVDPARVGSAPARRTIKTTAHRQVRQTGKGGRG